MTVLSRLTAFLRARRMWPLACGGVVRGPQQELPLMGEVPSEQTVPLEHHFPCYARSPAAALAWAIFHARQEANRQELAKALKLNSQWMDTVSPAQGELFRTTEPAQPTEPVKSADTKDFQDTSGFGL